MHIPLNIIKVINRLWSKNRKLTTCCLLVTTPYFLEFHNVEEEESGRKKLQTFMVYGDSIGVRYHALARKRSLCKEMFRTCNKKYMWTYDVSITSVYLVSKLISSQRQFS